MFDKEKYRQEEIEQDINENGEWHLAEAVLRLVKNYPGLEDEHDELLEKARVYAKYEARAEVHNELLEELDFTPTYPRTPVTLHVRSVRKHESDINLDDANEDLGDQTVTEFLPNQTGCPVGALEAMFDSQD